MDKDDQKGKSRRARGKIGRASPYTIPTTSNIDRLEFSGQIFLVHNTGIPIRLVFAILSNHIPSDEEI
jgi:hypothetical protein